MKKYHIYLLLPFYFLAISFVNAQSKTLIKKLKEFDAYVESSRKQWDAVGLAVTVVKDGEVIFKKGYGVKELGKSEAVDNNTLFACASTTKAMTATCMGILVDEGKVAWSDPVIKYLPEFQLYDPYATRELTIRDLFLHNSGVGNTDFLWSLMNISSEEVIERMRLVEPTYSLRSSFIYQNIFYLAAGQVIEKISGQSWEEFIKERIFTPLGMAHTVPTLGAIRNTNKTMPHMNVDGKMRVIEDMSADAIGPAGSVWSSIEDISRWALCMIDSGKYAGGRLVKSETWKEMMKVQTIVPPDQFYPTAQLTKPNWMTYGMGWFQHDYKGRKVNFHTGSLSGSIAIHGQIPAERIAVYVFGNTDHVEVRHALMYKAFDLFALGGTTDWSTDFLKLYTVLSKAGEAAQKENEKSRVANTKPSLPLTDYAGIYKDKLYGQFEVKAMGDKLEISINNIAKATLSHWHYDTFRGPFSKAWYGEATLQFQQDTKGEVNAIQFDGMTIKKVRP